MSRKVVIAAGGSGGHLFPAQALARDLLQLDSGCEVVFCGAGLSTNRFFEKERFAHQEISSATVFGKNPIGAVGSLLKGIFQSLRILSGIKPDLVVGFGSFHSFPLVVAALMRRVPVILFESNAVPGKVNKLLSRWAVLTAIQLPETARHLSGKTLEVAMPVWKKADVSTEQARTYFSLSPSKLTLLVFGGSQGSAAINATFCEAMAFLAQEKLDFQVIHLTGKATKAAEVKRFYDQIKVPAEVKEFEKDMPLAWKASNLVICRSGAATIAEQISFEVPGILIPYPHAYDHQSKNAAFMEQHVGGAVSIKETDLNAKKLRELIIDLVHPKRLEEMRSAIASFKEQDKKPHLATWIWNTLTSSESAELG